MEVVVGRIGRAHGVRGEVAVEVRTDDPGQRFADGAVLGTDPEAAGPLTVASSRPHTGRLLVRFEQVGDRDTAEGLRGVLLTAAVSDADRPVDPEEFYDHQLVGLQVRDEAGAVVGEVADVLHHPAHDLLVVRRGAGGEALVPFVTALVPDVDLERGRLTVADRPGLLDPERME
ncbi:MAG: ribosome maturation factor RimM [Actinomycetota bacterium]|nr:ribosome maturation factor RimM [Actinomycetota bacterium]